MKANEFSRKCASASSPNGALISVTARCDCDHCHYSFSSINPSGQVKPNREAGKELLKLAERGPSAYLSEGSDEDGDEDEDEDEDGD